MMFETIVKDYLDNVFSESGIPVFLETPKNLPEKFIVFQRMDIGKADHIDEITLEFSAFANSKYDAALLDESLREAMDDLHNTSDITVHLGGGNDNQDSVLKKYRFRSYFNLYY
ncbi:MAG: hypothetical protein IKU30_01690 [Clostridia bacterium]|nr:hypothetical protein [Clostridia bacterium]